MIKLQSVTINCVELETMRFFYETLGCQFEEFQVSKGKGGVRCVFSDFKMKLIEVNSQQATLSPVVQLSFQVESLDSVYQTLSNKFRHLILIEPFISSDGSQTMVLSDPQGNSIEIFAVP